MSTIGEPIPSNNSEYNPEISKRTVRAMVIALTNRKPHKSLLFHSDRGCQCSSKAYHHYLEEHQIKICMSQGGNPYNNACAESFFATMRKAWV